MKRRWWIIAAIVVLVAGLGYVAFSAQQRALARTAQEEGPAGETAVVQRGTLRVAVDASGSVAPADEVSVAFQTGGEVTEVLVEEGDVVEAGQLLARLDTDALERALAQADVNVRLARLDLADVREGPDDADLEAARSAVRDAWVSLEIAQENYEVKLNSDDDSNVRSRKVDYDWYVGYYQRKKAEFEDGRISQEEHDYAMNQMLKAEGRYNDALNDAYLEELEVKNQVDRARSSLYQAQDDLERLESEPLTDTLERAELAVDQALLKLEDARANLEAAELHAPIDGTVTSLDIWPGRIVGGNQTVAQLSDLAALEVEVYLDETDVAQVEIGQATIVALDAFPEAEMAGEVAYIAPVALVQSGVVLYPVTVRLSPTDLPVRGGMTADVEIVTLDRQDALIVPLRAVRSDGGRAFVQRVAGSLIEDVPVTLGVTTETEAEITSGLSEGDVVSVVPLSADRGGGGFGPGGMFGGGD